MIYATGSAYVYDTGLRHAEEDGRAFVKRQGSRVYRTPLHAQASATSRECAVYALDGSWEDDVEDGRTVRDLAVVERVDVVMAQRA